MGGNYSASQARAPGQAFMKELLLSVIKSVFFNFVSCEAGIYWAKGKFDAENRVFEPPEAMHAGQACLWSHFLGLFDSFFSHLPIFHGRKQLLFL